ncbi:peptidoglycan DD-metalloendopeptidase family protein [Desulfovibrio sp. OttesenSCG-928-C06]|nr:peptidoglycan DD-metalloendopeptidase family protein [Desulfovibrio sp. OttesenSCG-928-C06]
MNIYRKNKGLMNKIHWKRVIPALAVLLLLAGGGSYFLLNDTSGGDKNLTASATGGSAADSAAQSADDPDIQFPPEADPALASASDAGEAVADETGPKVYQSVIDSGDTLGNILQAWLSPGEINSLVTSCKGVYAMNRIRQGQPYAVHTDSGEFVKFEYEIDNDTRLVVAKTETGFEAGKEEIEYDIVLHRVEGNIASSLFNAMLDAGENAQLAVNLADVFAWEINFIRDLREGDSFTLLAEKRYRDGEFKGYGKLLAANFVNQGTSYEAFLFTDADGNSQYFNAEGDSLRRAFLKAPLSFTRISSGFSNRRLHPVLLDWRSHPAIDYAAPTGTPVKAVGKGTVIFKGYTKAAGYHVKIQHLNKYETMYLHLSAFAKGLQKGSKVSQGQVIGFVGQTGYATGPHLDFRMKKNGTFVNPLKELSPRDNPVTKKEMPRYLAQQEVYRQFLENRRNLAEYSRKMIGEL